jgi:hypothetical protein
MRAGAFDQSATALRSDILVFATATPRQVTSKVTGPITGAAVDRPDACGSTSRAARGTADAFGTPSLIRQKTSTLP